MKNIILFFGSFDPLHKGHMSIINNAIEKVNADEIYLGLNKNSSKGKLTSIYHRKNMLKKYATTNPKCKVLNFTFDYNNIILTYKNIFSFLDNNNHYYILIGQDQLKSLNNWYMIDKIKEKFDFIIARRGEDFIDEHYLNDNKYIFIDHQYKNISSSLIKKGKYEYTNELITKYILNHNLYLKDQIKPYLSDSRYLHTISVAKTALLINKKAKLGINTYKVEKAALLHDIGKNLDEETVLKLMNSNYKNYLNEDKKLFHQYLGEYLARENFHVYDQDILNAIKYHTTGRAKMSVLEQLIYVSDKIEPTRTYDTKKLFDLCIKDFNEGFLKVLFNNKKYIESKTTITNANSLQCYLYYLKEHK